MIDGDILLPVKEGIEKASLATIVEVRESGARILVDGEEQAGEKYYRHLSGYQPKIGDRVYFVRISNSYLILGRIEE